MLLTLSSPLLLIGGLWIYSSHARSTYLPVVISASSRLHDQFARGDITGIYTEADTAFRSAATSAIMTKFLARARRKLGTCRYSESNWNAVSTSEGTFVTIKYDLRCANDSGEETLTWRIVKGSALLVSMDMNSPSLLID